MIHSDETAWWTCGDDESPHESLIRLYRDERMAQAGHYRTLRQYAACYETGYGDGMASLGGGEPANPDRLFHNAAANAIDTWVAAVAGTRVIPQATSERGMYGQRSRAEDVNRGLQAMWDACDVETRKVECVRDFAISGLGAVWVYADDDEVVVQPIDPLDILTDRSESRLGAPRCMYIRVPMDRAQAIARFATEGEGEDGPGDFEGLVGTAEYRKRCIEDCPAGNFDDWTWSSQDILEVVVGFHLPSAKGASDGRMVIAIDTCALIDRPYEHQRFPVEVFRAKRSRRGYWGIGLMRSLLGAQREYEELTSKIERAHHRLGGSHFVVTGSSAGEDVIDTRELTNGIGTVIHVRDGSVREWVPTPVNDETVRYHASMPDDMLRFNGISPYAASGQIPSGITGSGEAQRVYQDTSNQRLVEAHRELERWTLGVANLMLDAISDVVERHGKYVVRAAGVDGFSEIDWARLIKDRASFALRIDPINFMAQTPSAKYARIDQWFNSQLIDQTTYKRLTGVADIQSEAALDVSSAEIVDKTIEDILDTGEERLPEPTDDLSMIVARGSKWVNLLRLRRPQVPSDRLDMVRQYVADAQAMLAKASAEMQAQAAPPAPEGALPPGAPPPGMPQG